MQTCSTNIRVGVPQARFSYPLLQDQALPGARDMERLRALIGPGRTSALLLGGQRIHGKRALQGLMETNQAEGPIPLEIGRKGFYSLFPWPGIAGRANFPRTRRQRHCAGVRNEANR